MTWEVGTLEWVETQSLYYEEWSMEQAAGLSPADADADAGFGSSLCSAIPTKEAERRASFVLSQQNL